MWSPPSYVCWFTKPMKTVVICVSETIVTEVMNQLSYRLGAPHCSYRPSIFYRVKKLNRRLGKPHSRRRWLDGYRWLIEIDVFKNLLLLVVYMVASQFANCEQLSESIPAAYKVVTSSMYIYIYIHIYIHTATYIYREYIYNSIHAYSYISTYYIRCSYNISICIYIYISP